MIIFYDQLSTLIFFSESSFLVNNESSLDETTIPFDKKISDLVQKIHLAKMTEEELETKGEI